jgi:D-alanyl-D-alanine dipeptidase
MTDLKRILTYADVVPVETRENGEELVVVQDAAPEILCQYENDDMTPYLGDKMVVRVGVAMRLQQAVHALAEKRSGAVIRLVYGYRHPEVQRRYFDMMTERLTAEHPDESPEEISRRVHQFVAVPELAGHPTGGAVDVTISVDGTDLDMGSQILAFDEPEKVPTFSDKISEEVLANRELLRDVLLEVGFAPFNGEWWHFSFGDREWAAFYGRPYALYSPVEPEMTP